MKKISIILAIIMLIGLLSSCEGIGDGSIENDVTNSTSFENDEVESMATLLLS